MSGIRVVIADDDAGVRAALHDILDADGRFLVVGIAADGLDLTRAVEASRPDVVLLDVRMPGGGVAAARSITELPRAPVVVAVSATTEVGTVVAMLRAGASGYLAKGTLGPWLPEMVARCTEGQVVLAVPNGARVLRSLAVGPDRGTSVGGPSPRTPVPPPGGHAA